LIPAVAKCRDAVGSIDQRFDLAVEVLRIGFEAQKQKQAGVGILSRVAVCRGVTTCGPAATGSPGLADEEVDVRRSRQFARSRHSGLSPPAR
jgi:hypothetical protein